MAKKTYQVNDFWLDIDKENHVDIESTDGVIGSVKINGEEAGGGGSLELKVGYLHIDATELLANTFHSTYTTVITTNGVAKLQTFKGLTSKGIKKFIVPLNSSNNNVDVFIGFSEAEVRGVESNDEGTSVAIEDGGQLYIGEDTYRVYRITTTNQSSDAYIKLSGGNPK